MAVDLLLAAKRAFEAGHTDAAWNQINIVLNEEWERPDALYVAGLIQRERGNVAVAAHLFRRALASEQKQVNLWMHYGACLHDMHLHDDARQAFEVVRRQLPTDAQPVANIASGYVQQGKLHDAYTTADEALKLNPDNLIAKIAKGYASLGLGRWRDAWALCEALYGEHVTTRIYNDAAHEEPEWDGTKGKTVVVTADQGIGDMILFAQCLEDMAKDCKRVIVEVPARLEDLFRRSFPDVHVYGTLGRVNMDWVKAYNIDARVNLSFLGRFYRNKDADFPRKPYLVPSPALQRKWMNWLEQFPKPWIGLAWEGGLVSTMKARRSIKLDAYAKVIQHGGTCFDLSYRDSLEEVARWNIEHPKQIVHPWLEESNYDDTVAFASVMDEVVTVTTALAHVCGALGRTARVLVPVNPQWRYQYRCGDGMIWYPESSVKLYRQKPGEDGFAPAINRLVKDMA